MALYSAHWLEIGTVETVLMTLRVLHSFPVWLPQTQTWMYNQIRHLPDDIDRHVVCERTAHLDQFQVPNIHCLADEPWAHRILNLGILPFRFRPYSRYMTKVIGTCRPDILHSHFGPVGWSDMAAVRRAGSKHVVTFYGQDVSYLPRHDPLWRRRYLELFDSVDLVLCEGHHMAGCIRGLGCPDDKVRVQRLGIALSDITFMPLGWHPGESLKVLISAAFREKKGIPDALEALGRLQHRLPLEITLVGDSSEDPRTAAEKERILAAIARNGLDGKIDMPGFLPHSRLMELAPLHHVFLSPSITADDGDTEGGAPVSLIEMSAAGLMVVSTAHCDIPQVVKHKETGVLAAERDVAGLVENLTWLLDNSDCWSRMRKAARNHVEENFDAVQQARRLGGIYKELTELA